MQLNPGDKVSFLNEKRDGIVVKILNNKMVLVEIEDGFNIPVLAHDLVRSHAFEETVAAKQEIEEPSNLAADEDQGRFAPRRSLAKTADDKDKMKHGLYMAYVPEYPDNVLSSGLGIYLVNHNPHDVLFTYSLKEQGIYVCKDFDKLDEGSAILINVIDISDIEQWNDLQFQFLFFRQDAALNMPPLVHEMHVKATRFYKEDNYIRYAFLNEKCFLISLSEKEEKEPEVWEEEKWENTKIEKKPGVKIVGHIKDYFNIESFPAKHIIYKGVAEVDLHIHELVEDYKNLDAAEIKNIQMNYFVKMLESAIANRFKKITFIHGVGEGRLKLEISEKMMKEYPDLKYYDAPNSRYGLGATEVMLG